MLLSIFRCFHLGGQSANDKLLRKCWVFIEILNNKNIIIDFFIKKNQVFNAWFFMINNSFFITKKWLYFSQTRPYIYRFSGMVPEGPPNRKYMGNGTHLLKLIALFMYGDRVTNSLLFIFWDKCLIKLGQDILSCWFKLQPKATSSGTTNVMSVCPGCVYVSLKVTCLFIKL